MALVGRRDTPTDAIRDYCEQLGGALSCKGVAFETVEVFWTVDGWFRALRQLWIRAGAWHGKWILLQYTALGWSQRGFPLGFLLVQCILRLRRVRFAIVYHDPLPFGGTRFVDRIRRICQVWVMRRASGRADRSILTLSPEKITWLPSSCRVAFIPVGANIPASSAMSSSKEPATDVKTIGIFGVTGGKGIASEAADIAFAVRQAKLASANLRILLFGRNSLDAEPFLRQQLTGSGVEIEALGLLEPKGVTAAFSRVDVVLFVRGGISARRGSAIAAIACGLPIVAYQSEETSFPVTEAGVLLVPQGDSIALARELGRVLSDDVYRLQLCERSRAAQQRYFSWTVIAESFLRTLANEQR